MKMKALLALAHLLDVVGVTLVLTRRYTETERNGWVYREPLPGWSFGLRLKG